MAALLALGAAATWGVGDFLGGLTSRRANELVVTALSQVAGLLVLAVLLPLGAMAQDAAVAVVLLSLCFGCTQATEGAYWSATIAVADRHASGATGMPNTGGHVVGGFGALLVPWMADTAGWIPALATGSVFALVGAVAWLFVRADHLVTGRETA